jgi:hypothetical protein
MEVVIQKSKKPDKKYDAVIDGKKTISFGCKGMSDFTQHHDLDRKQRYLMRHKKNENWRDPKTAGFYATNLLWNKNTLKSSVLDVNRRFHNVHLTIKP